MTYRAILLPKRYAFGAQGGPAFATVIATQESGDENREGTIGEALGRWTISYQGKREDVTADFRDFFYIVGGRRDTWRFWDSLDFTCTTAESLLTITDDSPASWQMWKRRTFGGLTYDQRIVLPVSAKTTVFGGGSYLVNETTGEITKVSGGDPTSFDCREFHKLCRFDTDHLVQTMENRNVHRDEYIASYSGIPVIEVPLTSA